LTDALFGIAISVLVVVGIHGVTALLTGLRSRADTDELTGLLNRRAVLQSAHNDIERAMRTQRPIAFLMYDLDHFKAVMDSTDKALCAAKNAGRNCVVVQGLSAKNSSTAA
jgi:GGDEF domain-containing protein